jgi:hypothetical protein
MEHRSRSFPAARGTGTTRWSSGRDEPENPSQRRFMLSELAAVARLASGASARRHLWRAIAEWARR